MAVLTPSPKMQFESAAGVPLSGGKVYTYTAGTTTPQATYTDSTGSTPNSNPIILNSRGEASIWLGAANYKFKLTDANDVEIWTVDYISAPTTALSPVLSGNVTIDSDTPGPALKITQTGTGEVLRVQDSTDPDATPFVIDNAGNLTCSGSVSFLPTGIICMWSGTIATIPSGWLLCDGTSGTPDLRDRFIIGARQDSGGFAQTNITGSLTQTGGSKDAIVVSHTHTAQTAGAHVHTYDQPINAGPHPTGSGRFDPTTAQVANTGSAGDHTHTINSTGSSGTNANLVPYYALAFIMRA